MPETAPTPPPSPPSEGLGWKLLRWGRRLLFIVVQAAIFSVLLLIALIGGWIQSSDFELRAISLVEGLIEDQTGEEATIGHLDIQFWPPGLELFDFELNNADDGANIVSVDRARAPVVLGGGGVQLGRVILDKPEITVHVGKGGKLREFSRMKKPDPNVERRPLKRLPWSSFQITDGAAHVEFPHGRADLTDLNLTPQLGTITDLSADFRLRLNDMDETAHILIEDIELGPEVVDIPPFEVRSRPLVISGEGNFPLQGEMEAMFQLHVPLEEINDALIEPRKAHGQVYADLVLEGTAQDPTVRLTALTERFALDLPGVFTPLLSYNVGDVSTSIVASKDEVRLENVTADLASGTLEAWGVINPKTKRLEDSRVVGDRILLRELLIAFDAAPTPWVNMTTDLEVAWSGDLNPLHLEGHFDFNVADLQVGDRPIADPDVELMLDIPAAHAKGTILLEKDHVYLSAPTVIGPRTTGSCTIDIGFGPRGPLDLQANLTSVNLNDFQPLNGVEMSGTGQINGRIWGPFNKLQMAGEGDIRDFSVLDIPYADRLVATIISPDMKSIELHGAQARKGVTDYGGWFKFDFKPPMAMDVDITFEQGRVEDAVGMFIDLPGMTGDLSGTLLLTGPLYDMDGEAHMTLGDIDLWGEKFEYGEAHGYMDKGLFTLDDVRVERHGGEEGLVLRGSVERDWALDMELFGDGIALERMTRLQDDDLPLTGNLSAYAHITNTLFDPSPAGRIAITDVRYNGHPVEDSHLVFQSDEGVMEYGGVILGGAAEADGTLGLWGEQPYDIDIAMADFPVHTLYPEGANGQPIRATTSGTVAIGGHFGEVWSPVDLEAHLDDVELRYADIALRNKDQWHYVQHGRFWAVENFGLVGDGTDLTVSASGGDVLDVDGSGVVDLALLKAGVPGLQRASGTAAVSIYAQGSPPDVEAVVDVDISADLLRHDTVPAPFEDLVATLRITDHLIEIQDLNGQIGGGTINGSGTIDAADWIPTRYAVDVAVRDAQVQWVDSLPAAIGDATLRFDGPVDAALLSGKVRIRDMPFADRIDWEDWVVEYRDEMLVDGSSVYEDSGDAMFALNIEIEADRTIRLRNNVAQGTASANLRVLGDTARPGLVGRVEIEEGLAYLQDREFVVLRGDILFNDPWTWDPDLDFDLQTDIDNLDQRYRVNYLVMGPFSNWRTETRSDPPLPQADVNALLWFGVTTEQLEETGELGGAVGLGVADMIVTDFFLTNSSTNELGGGAQELLQVDRVDFATGVNARGEYSSDPRLVVQWDLDDIGDIDVVWEMNVFRPDDNYVSVERPFAGAWSLAGWYATQQRDRVLNIGGAYGVDITWRGESD